MSTNPSTTPSTSASRTETTFVSAPMPSASAFAFASLLESGAFVVQTSARPAAPPSPPLSGTVPPPPANPATSFSSTASAGPPPADPAIKAEAPATPYRKQGAPAAPSASYTPPTSLVALAAAQFPELGVERMPVGGLPCSIGGCEAGGAGVGNEECVVKGDCGCFPPGPWTCTFADVKARAGAVKRADELLGVQGGGEREEELGLRERMGSWVMRMRLGMSHRMTYPSEMRKGPKEQRKGKGKGRRGTWEGEEKSSAAQFAEHHHFLRRRAKSET